MQNIKFTSMISCMLSRDPNCEWDLVIGEVKIGEVKQLLCVIVL